MAGDPFSVNHVNWLPGSVGPSSGFFEGFNSAYDRQYVVDSMYGLEDEVFDRWTKSLTKLETTTGQRFEMPLEHRDINNYVAAIEGKDPSLFYQQINLQGFNPQELTAKREAFAKANDAIKSLNNPDIPTMEDIVREVKQQRLDILQRSSEVDETGGFGATLGSFAGGVAGSFSRRDPLLVGSLPIGGWGRTAAARIATETGVIGGIEAVQQYAKVEPTRELLSEEPGSPLQNVLYAMVGAGLFRGGLEGAGKVVGKFNEGRASGLLAQERAANESWINSEKLREVLEANPQSPTARAGRHIFDTEDLVEVHNPYGDSEFGRRQFIADVEDIQRIFNGQPDTAIARFTPDQTIDLTKVDSNVELVREKRPEIVDQLEVAQGRLAEIDRQIVEAQDNIGELSVADAIARVDVDSGGLARSLEADLNNPQLTRAARAEIERKLDVIIESLGGAERIAAETKNATIRPKKELQSLRSSRKAANKRLREARQQFDEALRLTQAEARVIETLNRPMVDGRQKPVGPRFNPSDNRPDVVSTRSEEIKVAEETLDDTSESVANGLETDEGIDLGNGKVIDPEFRFSDPDNPMAEISARQLANEIKLDEQLLAAMKVCAI
jgi:hypothetical protein